MILSIIDEIKKALDNDMYVAALMMTLTIPDICGMAEYPQWKNDVGKRYKSWFDKYAGSDFKNTNNSDLICPYMSGEVIYTLRNSILHTGNPNIQKDNINDENNRIDKFILVKQPQNQFQIYSDFSAYSPDGWLLNKGETKRIYHFNIRRFCLILCDCAKIYYEDNEDKFDFFNYTIVDKEHEFDNIIE